MVKVTGTELARCENGTEAEADRPGNVDSNDDGICTSHQLLFLGTAYVLNIRTFLKCKLRHQIE